MKISECKVGMRVRYAPSPGRWFVGEVAKQPWPIGTNIATNGQPTWVTKLINMPADYASFTGKRGEKAHTVYAAALSSCEPLDDYGGHNINCRHTNGDATPVDKMDKATAYMQALQKQYGSAALSVAVARLLSLQDRYAAMQADWERMINEKPYYREDVRPIVADDLTEALNEGEP